jgi:low affinity Fe/Cu permease
MSWFLGSIIIVLLILLFNDKRKTKMIKSKLEDILREDSRERIKLGNLSRDKQELVRYINVFLTDTRALLWIMRTISSSIEG